MFHHVLNVAAAILVTLAATTAHADHSALAEHPLVASNLQLLEVWLQAEIDYRDQPGYVIGIVYDQELIYAKGFGFADVAAKRPMSTDTIFHIGSQSKTFTAVAILQLQEQGKLRLDDPVEKYIPGFAVTDGDNTATPITIFQLLTHTSGLMSEGTKTLHWSDLDFPTREHIDEQIKSVDLAFLPGTKRKYSNLGYSLAGLIVERASGVSFRDHVTENILVPLQMRSTYVELPEEQHARLFLHDLSGSAAQIGSDRVDQLDGRSALPWAAAQHSRARVRLGRPRHHTSGQERSGHSTSSALETDRGKLSLYVGGSTCHGTRRQAGGGGSERTRSESDGDDLAADCGSRLCVPRG